ncbi:MAG: hypothetical protein KJ000_20070 [Pirellulaceae bacterium]|nr:hypothetical protein [Pirellulaceae bacterium]
MNFLSRIIVLLFALAFWFIPGVPCCADETAVELKKAAVELREAAAELRQAVAELRELLAESKKPAAETKPVEHWITVGHLKIQVRPNFPDAFPFTVMKVLQTASDQLLPHVPQDHTFPPLAVEYHATGPMIFYERSREDPSTIVMRLSSKGAFWAQYVFQYSHELCHVIQNAQTQGPDEALFFYESLSHMASHYVLRALAVTWKSAPPLPGEGWTGFAPHLRGYSDDLVAKHQLPEGQTLAAWYAEQRDSLRKPNPSDLRPAYETIAIALLPLFEKEPDNWEAVTFLGRRRSDLKDRNLTFEEVLGEWRLACPERHRPLVDRIATEFGVAIK